MIEGVDFSAAQTGVTYKLVRANGKRFAIVRAGEGLNGRDLRYLVHRDGCDAAGLDLGAYWVLAPSSSNAAGQAAAFRAAVGSQLRPGTLPPMWDVEPRDEKQAEEIARDRSKARMWAAFLAEALRASDDMFERTCMVYGGAWLGNLARHSEEIDATLRARPFMLAAYTSATDVAPPPPKPWRDAMAEPTIWQYRGNASKGIPAGRCGGVPGDCDLDRFMGDDAAYNVFTLRARAPEPEAEPEPEDPTLA